MSAFRITLLTFLALFAFFALVAFTLNVIVPAWFR